VRSDSVFYFSKGQIQPLPARAFRAGLFGATLEDALQGLIEREPNLVGGRQLDPGSDDPPRFALLRREMPIGDWSVDHLLVDQRGILTLVEAKLVENRESRRDVIGQVMEYAANAHQSWSDGRLRRLCAEHWLKAGKNLDDVLHGVFGEIDVDRFWSVVESNLRQARFRLVIAADELRPEVRRVIEFLNGQLRSIQLFGLEIRCFAADQDSGVIASYVVGETQAAADEREARELRTWGTEELRSFYANEGTRCRRAAALLEWAVQRGCFLPARTQTPLFSLKGLPGARIAAVYPTSLYVIFRTAGYSSPAARDELVQDLKRVRLYPEDLDPHAVSEGRTLSRALDELTDDEFNGLLEILGRYCPVLSVQ
jgi:hypothetical protein